MPSSQSWFRRYGLYFVLSLITLLLSANIYLMYLNNQAIEHNKSQQEEAERIKVNTIDILRNLHYLDMISRTYALVKKDRFYSGMDTAVNQSGRIFKALETSLNNQDFPMKEFFTLRDSYVRSRRNQRTPIQG